MRPKIFQGYVVLLLVTTLRKFLWQLSLILQHPLMRYVWNHCDQAADMVRIAPFCWCYHMDLGFAIHKAALLKLEAALYFFYFNSATFQFCWIWCGKLALKGPNKTKSIFCIKFSKIAKKWSQDKTIFELLQVSTVRLCVWQIHLIYQ